MERTKEEFMKRFRGVPTYLLVRAINELTPGVNWSGCSKGYIAEAWTAGFKHLGNRGRDYSKISLDDIDKALKETSKSS
jgi:hypothetical protein